LTARLQRAEHLHVENKMFASSYGTKRVSWSIEDVQRAAMPCREFGNVKQS
jgi:hypothetical protein